MNKLLAILLLILTCSCIVYSQDYIPLIDTNKRWNMTRHLYNAQTYTFTARIKNIDTLINGNTYQKVVSDTIYTLTPTQAEGYLGYIREDLTTKKVYYTILDKEVLPFYFEEDEERLLYDFSLELGDTVEVMGTIECPASGFPLKTLKVVEIDSVELLDNSKRKRWTLTGLDGGNFVRWIEGIGSEYGLYMPSCPYTAMHWYEYSLLCFYQDNEHLYQEPNKNTCAIFWTSNTDEVDKSKLSVNVYPNPVSDEINIEFEITCNCKREVIIYNTSGLEVLKETSTSNSLNIKLEMLPKGVYYLNIRDDENHAFAFRKVIKL